MKPKYLKKLLLSEIKAVAEKSDDFCIDSSRNFSRKRKLSFETVVKTIIGLTFWGRYKNDCLYLKIPILIIPQTNPPW